MSPRNPKPRGHPFAPGNKAAAKPAAERTIARTYRLPPRTLAQIRGLIGADVQVNIGDEVAEKLAAARARAKARKEAK